MTNLHIEIDQEIDIDSEDIYEPPSSPPPVHAIYFPESYHHAGTPQDDIHHQSVQKNFYAVRRTTYTLAKKTLTLLIRKTNLLLITNYLNKLWRHRMIFYRGMDTAAYYVRTNGYRKTLLYVIHFFRFQIIKYLIKQNLLSSKAQSQSLANVAQYSLDNPRKSFFVALSLLKHTSIFIMKFISKSIKNIGGLDSILLAFSTIALTKSIQHSNTIF